MNYLDLYTEGLNNKDLSQSVRKTSNAVLNNINLKFRHVGELTGLLLGNVQSGKTAQMLGIISLLADEGYRLFLLLTTDNVDLQRQTYNRVKNALVEFDVLSENESQLFNPNNHLRPVIIVLKKNSSILRKWGNILSTSQFAKGSCLCIFDDEADAASLNTAVNRGRTSTINNHLQKIKSSASCSLYFEVTATPQGIVLQSSRSGWKPSFVNYFKPGDKYLGGNFFYSTPKSYCIRFTAENELDEIKEDGDSLCPKGLRDSIMSFLVVCAHKRLNHETNCNFMIHPSVRINIHRRFVSCVQEYLTLLQQSSNEEGFDSQLKEAWYDLQQTKPDLEHYDDIKSEVIEILDETLICVIPLNSKSNICRDPNNPDALDLSKGFNVVVGGNTLGRGITFPNLQTVYYCRASKTPHADTFWQHSRVFGYDRIKELIRVFIPKSLHNLFVSLNEANEILIKQIEQNFDKIELIYPEGVKPTRANVVDKKYLNLIVGGVNMFATNPIPSNTQSVNNLVEQYATEPSVECAAEDIIEILRYVGGIEPIDFDSKKFTNCIKALKGKRPLVKCRLIIRINRDIGKGTGTLLSPTDRRLSDSFKDEIVLTLYRIVGSKEKGWYGFPIWIPNIRFPDGTCYYDTID